MGVWGVFVGWGRPRGVLRGGVWVHFMSPLQTAAKIPKKKTKLQNKIKNARSTPSLQGLEVHICSFQGSNIFWNFVPTVKSS